MGDSVLFWAPFAFVVVFVALCLVLGLWIRRFFSRRWGNITLPKPPSDGRLSPQYVQEVSKALAEMAEIEHDPTMAASFQQVSSALSSPVFVLSGYASTTSFEQRSATWEPDEPFRDLRDAERAAISWLESQGAESRVEVTDVLAGKVIEVATQDGIDKIPS